MAKIKDFLERLEPRTYTDEELEDLGKRRGLDEEKQIKPLLSHNLNRIRKAIEDEEGDVTGQALRVVM